MIAQANIVVNSLSYTINYKVTGKGYDLVLLHGWGCSLSIFDRIHSAMEPYFRVWAIDFPGFGESSAPQQIIGIDDYTQIFEAFATQLGISNPILVGHSFGGRVSILYASRNTTHKVILVDAAGVKPRHSLNYYLKIYSYKAYKKILPLLIGRKRAEERIETYRKQVGSSDYQALSGTMRGTFVRVVNEDLRHAMPKIKAPTLLFWGKADTATPIGDAYIMKKLIPDAGLVAYDGVGHYSFLERPIDFEAVLNSFLEKEKQPQL